MAALIPDVIQPLLKEFAASVQQQLPGFINGLYLEGSIALGGFNERFSDVDFIALLEHPASAGEFDALRQVHHRIEKQNPRWKLSGWYLASDELRRGYDRLEPVLKYHDGLLGRDASFEIHSVEGWILKNKVIALIGPEPQMLPFEVDWQIVLRKMRVNMNTYWAGWTRRPDALLVLLSDWGIQWAVLGVLRQFYSFRENSITTKIGAAEYALPLMPPCWQRLIREALNIREGRKERLYSNRVGRMVEAVKFLRSIIALSTDAA